MRGTMAGIALAALMAACGGGDDTTDRLEEAACADLRSGTDIQAAANSGIQNGMSRRRVAAVFITAIDSKCPEFRDDLDRSLLPGWLND